MIFIAVSGFAQDAVPPVLHCTQVNGTDITLTWQSSMLAGHNFVEYRICRREYFVNDSLDFLVGVIADENITSIIDPAASINEEEYYLVKAVYDSLGSSDTLVSSLVQTFNFDIDEFQDKVTFDLLENQFSESDSTYLNFIPQYNYQGNWVTMDTLAYMDSLYTFRTQVCDTVTYLFRVLLEDEFGCVSVSSVIDHTVYDTNAPGPPVIETVTVDTAIQKAVVCWFPVPEGDIAYYTVQYDHPDPNLWQVDAGISSGPLPTYLTIDGPLSNGFDYNVNFRSTSFIVIATDTCTGPSGEGNATTFFDCIPHSSIFIEAEFDKCNRSTFLEWNPYVNWAGGVDSYVIFGGVGNAPMQVLDTIAGEQVNFTHMNVPLGVEFKYMVKALSVNGYKPSLSIIKAVVTEYPDTPDFTYLANVTVAGPNAIEVKALIDSAAPTTRYRFEKLGRFGDEYELLASRDQDLADSEQFISIVDTEVRPGSTIHEYRLISIDSCGNAVDTSQVSSNIKANVLVDNEKRSNYISWTPYSQWYGDVLRYDIFQVKDGVQSGLIASVSSNRLYYEDVVDSIQDFLRDAQYCYVIQGVEGVNLFGVPQVSKSNVICGTLEPLIWIPNAITPNGDGLNDVFSPVAGYFDRVDGYVLEIYDRWGSMIFQTQDYGTPWSGEDGSEFVQEGVYIFKVRFITGDGTLFERYGNISVLLPKEE